MEEAVEPVTSFYQLQRLAVIEKVRPPALMCGGGGGGGGGGVDGDPRRSGLGARLRIR